MSFIGAREHGAKVGSAGVASNEQQGIDRRERLRKLALETIDLNKDPYFMRNHLGQYECRLCLTLHTNEGNYLAHTQGKRHQQNLAKRAAREATEKTINPAPKTRVTIKKTVKIGKPGYRITKQFDPDLRQRSLLFQIDYPEILEGTKPRHRFMSAYEQKVEPADGAFQYILFSAEPYEVIAFKVPNAEVDKSEGRFFVHWDAEANVFSLSVSFKNRNRGDDGGEGGGQQGPPPQQQQQQQLPPPPAGQQLLRPPMLGLPPQFRPPMGAPGGPPGFRPPMMLQPQPLAFRPPMGLPPRGPPGGIPRPPMGLPQRPPMFGMAHAFPPMPQNMARPPMMPPGGMPPPGGGPPRPPGSGPPPSGPPANGNPRPPQVQ